MNARYLLLATAYQQRDRYMLILFGIALLCLLTEWATDRIPWLHAAYHIFLIAAFVGASLYAWAHPVVLP